MNSNNCKRLRLPVVIVAVILITSCVAELCPDHKQLCRSGQTCCDNKQGGYGCCPYAGATCCTDGLHCCPPGTSCDLSAGRCRRNKVKFENFDEFLPSQNRIDREEDE